MKIKYILKSVLILCLFFSQFLNAQSQFPSPERVEVLLEILNECKKNKDAAESEIKHMEEQPLFISLQTYLDTREQLDSQKRCIDIAKEALASIRKDHPEWFNLPGATVTIHGREKITPRDLENKVATIEEHFAALFERFGALEEPED